MKIATQSWTTTGKAGGHPTRSIPLRSASLHSVLALLLLAMLTLPATAPAGESAPWTDLRGQSDASLEAFAAALFPAPLPVVRTRGMGRWPVPSAGSGPQATVVLNVYFASNSEAIPSHAYVEIDKLGTVLSWPQYSDSRVQLTGHTDSLGNAQKNQALSERRVQSITAYLVRHFHIAPERLGAVGYGASKPLASNDTPEGRRQNRRVEVVNLGGSGV